MSKVSIISLTYNQLENATKPYIESLYKYTDENMFELIIIDNNSTDGTIEYLKQLEFEKSNVRIIYNKENLGYSKGNNQGIKIAKGDFIGLLNNDILLTPDWLYGILDIFDKEKKAGLVSANALNPQICNINNYPKKIIEFKREVKEEYFKVLDGLFCCVFFKKDFVDKVGLLDENFSPAWFEDNDYSFRSILAGYYNFISNTAYIFHNYMQTSINLTDGRNEILERNKAYYFSKYNYLAQYCWEINLERGQLKKELMDIKSAPYKMLFKKNKIRFKRIFRYLLKI